MDDYILLYLGIKTERIKNCATPLFRNVSVFFPPGYLCHVFTTRAGDLETLTQFSSHEYFLNQKHFINWMISAKVKQFKRGLEVYVFCIGD